MKADGVLHFVQALCDFVDVIAFYKGVRDVFRRTADHPIERDAVLLGQIIALLERVDDRENIAAIVKRTVFVRMRDGSV